MFPIARNVQPTGTTAKPQLTLLTSPPQRKSMSEKYIHRGGGRVAQPRGLRALRQAHSRTGWFTFWNTLNKYLKLCTSEKAKKACNSNAQELFLFFRRLFIFLLSFVFRWGERIRKTGFKKKVTIALSICNQTYNCLVINKNISSFWKCVRHLWT